MPQQGTDVIAGYETQIWRQGWYFGLGFQRGYVFGKTLGYEPIVFEWNFVKRTGTVPFQPQPMDANEFINFQQMTNEQGQPVLGTLVGEVSGSSPEQHLYQLYRGVYPNCAKIWTLYASSNMWDLDLDDIRPGTPGGANVNNNFGYFDGDISPFHNPSLTTELLVPYNLGFQMAVLNDSPWQHSVKIKVLGVRHLIYMFKKNVPADVETVKDILAGKRAVTLNYLGPIDQGVQYSANRDPWQNAMMVELTPEKMSNMLVRGVA